MKTCFSCKQHLSLELFYSDKTKGDGHSGECISCRKSRKQTIKFLPDPSLTEKKCYNCQNIHPITLFGLNNQKKDGYDITCKLCRNEKAKQKYLTNPQHFIDKVKARYHQNKPKSTESRKKHQRERLKVDPKFKVARNLRNRLYYALKNKGWKKDTHFAEYIGCEYDDLVKYLESQFTSEMNWDNYGKLWAIDHVMPLSLAPDLAELYKSCHYTNLAPILIADNARKTNNLTDYLVQEIEYVLCEDMMKKYHYSKKAVGGSHYFGLFYKDELVGAAIVGKPFTPHIADNLVTEEMQGRVLELKRLCLSDNKPNEASYFVSRILKMLPSAHFVVSFADPSENHSGKVYQACNFLYLGLTQKKKNYVIEGHETLHPLTLGDKIKNNPDTKYTYKDRVQKHRYVYITGNGRTKKRLIPYLKYPTQQYP